MKFILKVTLLCILALAIAGSSFAAKKKRKLPESAYIKAAKIEILSGKLKRYKTATSLLDSLFLNYGPHAEGLNLMASIYVDYTDKTAGPVNKMPYVKSMVAYFDSLQQCCDNPDIKKKYRKDCDKFTEKADSTSVKYWREFYNAGIEQLTYLQELSKELETATDSATIAYTTTSFETNIDSCIANMELALTIDPGSNEPYIAIGNAYEYKKDFREAVKWLAKGLDKVSNKSDLLLAIAYDYIRIDEYCEAIPYFKEYTELAPEDMGTLFNLSICYTNCEKIDEAFEVYQRILVNDPENLNVISSVGNYFNQKARAATNAAAASREAGDTAQASVYMKDWEHSFDSSLVYFKRLFDLSPEDPYAAEQYAVVNAIRGKYEDAAVGFSRLTTLEPDKSENWTYLGDCYLNLKEFKKATTAYEKVVELEPDNKETWERLVDLYAEIGETKKKAAAEKKLNSL